MNGGGGGLKGGGSNAIPPPPIPPPPPSFVPGSLGGEGRRAVGAEPEEALDEGEALPCGGSMMAGACAFVPRRAWWSSLMLSLRVCLCVVWRGRGHVVGWWVCEGGRTRSKNASRKVSEGTTRQEERHGLIFLLERKTLVFDNPCTQIAHSHPHPRNPTQACWKNVPGHGGIGKQGKSHKQASNTSSSSHCWHDKHTRSPRGSRRNSDADASTTSTPRARAWPGLLPPPPAPRPAAERGAGTRTKK